MAKAKAKNQAEAAAESEEVTYTEEEGVSFEGGIEVDEEGGTVDMGGVDENYIPPPVPNGWHNCAVINVDYSPSQRSGNMMWTVRSEVIEGEAKGRALTTYLTFTEGGVPQVKRALLALGREDLAQSSSLNPKQVADDDELVGLPWRLRTQIRRGRRGPMANVTEFAAASSEEGDAAFLEE